MRQMIPTREALVQRARDMAPALVERVDAGRRARRLPDGTVADMQDAGFFRIVQPARYGGYEHDPRVLFEVQREVAAACPSTAWVLGVVAVHSWQLALFPEEAQEEVWGDDTSVLVSSSYMPVGKVQRVDGGFRLSGRWSFSSGSQHCDWVFLGAFVPPEPDAKGPDMRTFLLPRSDYTIVENWDVTGLQATGSHDVVVDDVFVPEHRTHRFRDGFLQRSPGHAINEAPLFKLPFGLIFVRSVSTGAIGMLQGALDAYMAVARTRVGQADGARAAQNTRSQEAAARALVTLHETWRTLDHDFEEMMAYCRSGEKMPIEKRVEYRYNSSNTVVRCVQAVDELYTASGGRAIFQDTGINRFFHDIHAARGHFANNPDKPVRNLGAVLLGQKNTDFFL